MLSPDTLIFCFAERPSWYRGGREEDIVMKVTAATGLVRILKAEAYIFSLNKSESYKMLLKEK
jgi:hypothetical protein